MAPNYPLPHCSAAHHTHFIKLIQPTLAYRTYMLYSTYKIPGQLGRNGCHRPLPPEEGVFPAHWEEASSPWGREEKRVCANSPHFLWEMCVLFPNLCAPPPPWATWFLSHKAVRQLCIQLTRNECFSHHSFSSTGPSWWTPRVFVCKDFLFEKLKKNHQW